MPARCWDSGRRSESRKALASSYAGTRRFMEVSPERLVEQANERFQLQDYYGAIHLLEEVVGTGREFADAHHLLGLSYSLAGQADRLRAPRRVARTHGREARQSTRRAGPGVSRGGGPERSHRAIRSGPRVGAGVPRPAIQAGSAAARSGPSLGSARAFSNDRP